MSHNGAMNERQRLASTLRTTPDRLGDLTPLDDGALTRLDGLVRSAVERESLAIDRSMNDALGFLPRPLRGPVRRILGTDER